MTLRRHHNSKSANDVESPRRYIIGLIVAHTILVVFAVSTFSTGFTDYKWPRWQSIFIVALAASQVGLLSASLVFGTVTLPLRVVALSIVLTFWLIVLNDLGLDQDYWLAIFAIQIAGIVACLAIARLVGLQLIRDRPGADKTRLAKAAYHFSLRKCCTGQQRRHFCSVSPPYFHISLARTTPFDLGVRPRAYALRTESVSHRADRGFGNNWLQTKDNAFPYTCAGHRHCQHSRSQSRSAIIAQRGGVH